VEPWLKHVTWVNGDIVSQATMEVVSAYHKIDKIVHVATYTPYGDIEKQNTRTAISVNLEGTANLLELGRRLGIQRFVYISSIAAYGGLPPSDQPLREDLPLTPRGIYGITKVASELLTERYGQLHNFATASMRLSQNWGTMERVTPYHSRQSIPFDWVGKAVRGEPIEPSPFGKGITESRTLSQDHIYVKDMAAFIGHVLDAPRVLYPVYNVATGTLVSLHDLVSAIRVAYPKVKFTGPIPKTDESKGRGRMYDVSRMREQGFVPKFDLVAALKDYIEWRQTFNFMD
jgi:nucleoside-diphosphate-sugar epimerase